MTTLDKVDLPQPDSPTRPRISPFCTVSETSSTALTVETVLGMRRPFLTGKYTLMFFISRKLTLRDRSGIKDSEALVQEESVLANQLPVEVDFPSAIFRALDADHVPMDLGAVGVVGVFIRLSGGEVE